MNHQARRIATLFRVSGLAPETTVTVPTLTLVVRVVTLGRATLWKPTV